MKFQPKLEFVINNHVFNRVTDYRRDLIDIFWSWKRHRQILSAVLKQKFNFGIAHFIR